MTLFAATAAKADVLYSDGPANDFSVYGLESGYAVEDSFTLAGPSIVTGATFVNLLYGGGTGLTVEWAIVRFEGSALPVCPSCSGTAELTATSSVNEDGVDIVDQMFSIPSLTLSGGTYWLELQNEVTSGSYAWGWEINGGPSSVWYSAYGDQNGSNCVLDVSCAESFEVLGDPVPEPSTLPLLLAGLAGLGGFARRRRSLTAG